MKKVTVAEAKDLGFIELDDAAKALGVHRDTLSRWIKDGRLPAVKLGPRFVRIRRKDFEAFLKSLDSIATSS